MRRRVLRSWDKGSFVSGKICRGEKGEFIKMAVFLLFLLLIIDFIFPLAFSRAQNVDVFDLGSIVITATRVPQLLKNTPGSVTVITEKEIKLSGARNVGEVLERVAGIKINSYGFNGMSSLSLRGSSANQVLVMIDGRPINLASSGSVDLSQYSLENVRRIEIARGPFSALYGAGALGGVVNIITKNPPRKTTAELKLSQGSFNSSFYHLLYGSGKDKSGYLFTIEKDYSRGDRQNSWRNFFNLNGKITYFSSLFSGGYSQDKEGVPGSLSYPTPKATQNNKRSWFDFNKKWSWRKCRFLLKGFLNQNKIIYENPDRNQRDTTKDKTLGINFQNTIFLSSKHNFIWGVDWREDEVDIRTINGTSRIGGKRKVNSGSLYLQDEVKPFSNSTLVLGARYDNHSVYGSQLSPRIGFLHHFGKLTSLRLSWGKAFRAPTIDDLYWQEDWGWGMGLFGNPDLTPEKSSEYEVGIEHIFTPEILGRATFFSSCIDDLISWVETSPWRWEAQNIDKAKIKGLETEIKLKLLRRVFLSFNYTYLEAKDDREFKGKFLPYRPQNKFFCTLRYKIRPELLLYLEGKIVGKRYTNRENTQKLPSYSLIGARLIFNPNRKSEIFVKVDNLLDEKYEDVKGYPMPGRTIKGGIKVTL